MRSIAIVNHKGGSGKTTTTVNLAAALAERKKRVLVVDIDPQASASAWLGVADGGQGLLDVFRDAAQLGDLVVPTAVERVDLIPSSTWLIGAEKTLAAEIGAETVLRRKCYRLAKDRWDYLLIDCPPTLGLLTINALSTVNEVLVPVEAHVMALQGLAQIVKTVQTIRERLNAALAITGILACRVDGRTRHCLEVLAQLREHFGDLVHATVIRENVRLAEAPSFAAPITVYDRASAGAEDYLALAAEVIKQERRLAAKAT